jgi:predicted ester cyclase
VVDVEPTYESIELHGATVYELDDGRVTEAWWHYDNVAFLTQLGLAPEGLTA